MPREEKAKAKMVGEPIHSSKSKICYGAVEWNQHILKKNSVVLLEADPKPYVGLISEIFHSPRKKQQIQVDIRWFFRWGDLENDISHITRKRYENEVFLGLTTDVNDVETIIGPCDFRWITAEEKGARESEKKKLQKTKTYFCSHVYDGKRLIPFFDSKLKTCMAASMLEELGDATGKNDKIANLHPEGEEDDVEELELSAAKKRKKSASAPTALPASQKPDNKRLKKTHQADKGKEAKAPTFDEIKNVTLSRQEVIAWHMLPNSHLLAGFFVRVPVQRGDQKSYLLAMVTGVKGLNEDEVGFDGYRITKSLSLQIPEVPEPIDSSIKHVSSQPLTPEEFEHYLRVGSLPPSEKIQEKQKHKLTLQMS